ncbi:hypothetical protein BKP35_07090 [Anaerobacillus arseniciselenatis]|uniref:type II site-specific deoxyribonuclease n=1 Tax=Anaerobacillus arseniciselenatis TaxID=85682 RepID=A0A1S2LP04_9BACI|nr:TdeIII family type II restriction endonuclease [Anaerobacillus arseniciselenatis]OIJ14259.1 hypothetical protein BKP35_07090 [Anaerobacillus arseniciselenatis]
MTVIHLSKSDMKKQIKRAIYEPFFQVTKNVRANFAKNQKGRENNFFIHSIPGFETIAPVMTITRSLESSTGNAIQKCARNISILTYGRCNVPTIINPNNLEFDLDDAQIQEKLKHALGQKQSKKDIADILHTTDRQVIVSNISDANPTVEQFMSRNNATHENIKSLLTEKISYPNIHFVPIDLGYFVPTTNEHEQPLLHIHEIKAGGNLDSKNAHANARKLFTHYCHANYPNAKVYFSTAYNNKGEGEKFHGSIVNHLSDEMILSGSSFWETILPEEITFATFKRLYQEVMEEMQFSKLIYTIFQPENE